MVLPTPTFITEEIRFNLTRGPQRDHQTVTLSEGNFVSIYRVPNGDILVQQLDLLGRRVGPEQVFVATGNTEDFAFDAVALEGNQIALTFERPDGGIELTSVVYSGTAIVGEGDLSQTIPAVDGSTFAVPQLSGTNAANLTLHFLNDTADVLTLEEHRDLTDGAFTATTSSPVDATGSSAIDAVLLADGNRVVVIDTNGGGDSAENVIEFHIIAPDGTILSSGTTASGSQDNVLEPQVIALADGAFAIAYRGVDTDSDVFFDIFEADGTVRTSFVNAAIDDETDFHRVPFLVALEDGGFVALFLTDNSTARGRRFDADGNAVGDQFLIDNVGSFAPSGTVLADDRLAITFIEGGTLTNRIAITEEELQFEATEGNDAFEGSGQNEDLNGLGGADTLDGASGNDTLEGGAGADNLDGGLGRDVLSYAASDAAVNVFLAFNAVSGGHGDGDVIANFEDLSGSVFDDRLSGDENANRIVGGNGNDIIKSKGGEDTLVGGNGNDKIVGSNDEDSILGGNGDDTVQGFDGNDEIESDAGNDFVVAGRGNDLVLGGDGDDRLRGNRGQDFLEGGDGDDDLRGGSGADQILGDTGRDVLIGEGGGDSLFGGSGNDVLRGGFAGEADGDADVFLFSTEDAFGGGFDRVKDFEDGIDQIGIVTGNAEVQTFEDILALSTDQNNGLKIALGNGDTLFIENFSLEQFDETDVNVTFFNDNET